MYDCFLLALDKSVDIEIRFLCDVCQPSCLHPDVGLDGRAITLKSYVRITPHVLRRNAPHPCRCGESLDIVIGKCIEIHQSWISSHTSHHLFVQLFALRITNLVEHAGPWNVPSLRDDHFENNYIDVGSTLFSIVLPFIDGQLFLDDIVSITKRGRFFLILLIHDDHPFQALVFHFVKYGLYFVFPFLFCLILVGDLNNQARVHPQSKVFFFDIFKFDDSILYCVIIAFELYFFYQFCIDCFLVGDLYIGVLSPFQVGCCREVNDLSEELFRQRVQIIRCLVALILYQNDFLAQSIAEIIFCYC